MKRGEVRLCRFARPDKRRPVLVLTRDSILGRLHSVTVAPITRTQRGLPTEVALTSADGMKYDCAVNFDHVVTVPLRDLGALVGTLSSDRMSAACRALGFALGCASSE